MTVTADRGTDQHIEVHTATTGAEREAVYRFRFDVYVEELGRYGAIADHANRLLADPEDDRSWIVYATAADDVIGSLRLTWGGDGFSAAPGRAVPARTLPRRTPTPAHGGRRANDDRVAVARRRPVSPRWASPPPSYPPRTTCPPTRSKTSPVRGMR